MEQYLSTVPVTSLALEHIIDQSFRSDIFERWSRAEVCLDSIIHKSNQPGSNNDTKKFLSAKMDDD